MDSVRSCTSSSLYSDVSIKDRISWADSGFKSTFFGFFTLTSIKFKVGDVSKVWLPPDIIPGSDRLLLSGVTTGLILFSLKFSSFMILGGDLPDPSLSFHPLFSASVYSTTGIFGEMTSGSSANFLSGLSSSGWPASLKSPADGVLVSLLLLITTS